MKVVLASESQFRRRALDMLGLTYETCPSGIDEKAIRARTAGDLTRKLAEAKALDVADRYGNAIIVSGDAVAVKGDCIFEKPRTLDEARRFLKELSGSEFQFVTALAVVNSASRKMLSTVETSTIVFRELLNREIEAYISQYPVLRFAGAFESDAVLRYADRISGSYNFVTALPLSRLTIFLRQQGVEI